MVLQVLVAVGGALLLLILWTGVSALNRAAGEAPPAGLGCGDGEINCAQCGLSSQPHRPAVPEGEPLSIGGQSP